MIVPKLNLMFITNNVKGWQSYNKQLKLTIYIKDNASADVILTRNSFDYAWWSSAKN